MSTIIKQTIVTERYTMGRYATVDERMALERAGFELKFGTWVKTTPKFEEVDTLHLLTAVQ